MLKVYAAKWCPHCTKTIEYLKKNKIEFQYFEIEKQSENTIQKIIKVNGGDDWVVPTLEFNGIWRAGKIYNEKELASDLKKLGLK
ncbi:MAG: glutaredoxin family protein [Deltaproteobacteria bacterium]|nr:glutaredoxin family protein [Candidatus Desulfobacula maris]